MATEKRLKAYDPITFASFTRHATKHREPYDQYDMGYMDAVDNIEDWLEANTVDAVEVVRCKDCRHYHADTLSCDFTPHGKYYERPNWYEDDFCSYGERKR